MGFLDRLVGKTSPKPAVRAPAPAAPSAPPSPTVSTPEAPSSVSPAGKLVPQLAQARERLEQRDLDGAKAIYEDVLQAAGDRPDVLVTISGDLGSCGFLEPIVELIAPRYDAERHGPATGLNLLQAYLALRNPEAAQHVLDILFALQRPDLEERLWGFSNAIAELIEERKRGLPGSSEAAARQIHLVTVSKPIWSYGIEALPDLLPPKPSGVRRVAFAQLATPGLAEWTKRMAAPEDALGRFSRGLPLWLAETLYFSAQYEAAAAVGVLGQSSYALFPVEWTSDNVRQLVDTGGKFDYVLTGAVQEQSGDFGLILRLWEIKTFRQRKSFEVHWTPADADAVLAKLHEQLRVFFEWKPAAGLPYVPPVSPTRWIDSLGVSLSHFLIGKGVLPKEQLTPLPANLADPATGVAASLAHLTLIERRRQLGLPAPDDATLIADPWVDQAKLQWAGPAG
jgi:hypothetical protein